MTDHLEVARATAAVAPVFPCLPDKRPATPHGFKDATTDPWQITTWWTDHPAHLIAIPTAGLIVVDLDNPSGGFAAWDHWRGIAEPHGWTVDDTLMVFTPRDGLHIFYRAPDGTEIRNSASKLAPNIDIRGHGGYVIVAGSTLPDGRRYEIANPLDPWTSNSRPLVDGPTIAEAPPWLVERLTATPPPIPPLGDRTPTDHRGTPYGLRALEGELGRVAVAREGTRNETLNRAAYAAGQLIAGGQLDPVHAANELAGVALRIGLSTGEINATVRSGMAAGHQHPRRPADAR